MARNLIAFTSRIAAAYVQSQALPPSQLPSLITSIHHALASVAVGNVISPEHQNPEPAVPIRKSVTHDYIICLEDGKKLKMLKRHLYGLGLTPDAYRSKWGLPADYPMVAPAYAARRSELAKSIGLGKVRRRTAR